jgi:LacI family transcriptional regulator
MSSSKRVTLGMIAERAGVSRATVSRALRNHPQLPKSTCERIQSIAEEMGWRPDPEASKLMHYLRETREKRSVSTLAVLNDYPARNDPYKDPYTATLLKSAKARADVLGFQMDEIWLREPGMTAARVSSILRARGISGVLIPPEVDPLPRIELDWDAFSSVATTTTAMPERMNRVLPDNYGNFCKIMEALVSRGLKRILLLSLRGLEARTEHCPTHVYHAYCARNSDLETVPVFYWDDEGGTRDPMSALGEYYRQTRPDAVLVADRWLLESLEKATGTRAGTDYFAACYSNADPDLPGLDQRPALVGSAAIDLLSAHVIRGETGIPEVPKHMRIPGGLAHW